MRSIEGPWLELDSMNVALVSLDILVLAYNAKIYLIYLDSSNMELIVLYVRRQKFQSANLVLI